MYCATCKIEFPDSYRFCPLCGRSAVQNDKNVTPSGTTTETINGTAAGTTAATTAQTPENTVSTQTPENVSANSGSNSAPVTSESTAESSNSQNTSGASQATQNANAYEPVRSTKIPVKTAEERQEDAIWSSFKNEDSYSRDRNYNNDYTGYTPNYNYSRQSSAKPIAIVGIISAVLILGFAAWHFSWFGINNDISSALGMKLSTVTLRFDARHSSKDVDTEEMLECSIRHIGDFTLYTDENNEVINISYSSDDSENTSSYYNVCGVYPGQDKSDAEEALKKVGFHEYEDYLSDDYVYDATSDYAHIYYAGSGSDTVYMKVVYNDGVSDISYVNGNASE